MIYYNAYIQITQRDILVVVTNEKNKNQTVIVDSFQMEIKEYINDNGLIQYPLALAEDVSQKLNNEKYSVKDITLIISPKDTVITANQENAILNPKELTEFAKNKIDNTFKKPPEAYEMAWMHTGDVLDDGAPYSIFLQYCYPLREVNKLKKAFSKNKMHISNVVLPELATAALFSQYLDEFNDPTTLIIESGHTSSINSATTTYWYKRNILESVGTYKVGLSSIVKDISNSYNRLSHNDIVTLLLSCGAFKEHPTDDADEIFSLNGINREEWFAIATRAFHTFATTLKNDIQRRTEKPDIVIFTGPLACISGVKEYLYLTYSLMVDIWENKFDMKIGQTSIIYNSSIVQSPMFATVVGAIYFQYWTRGMKKGTLSKPILEININKYNKYVFIALIAAVFYAGYLYLPGFINMNMLKSEQSKLSAEVETAQSIQANIARYSQNIETQTQFLERSKMDVFNMQKFIFSATLLKPKLVTIMSIDTPNFLEKVVDTQPYYYIRKSVENKFPSGDVATATGSSAINDQKNIIDISGKDWTFGLDWKNVSMTSKGIKQYLADNGVTNISPYIVSKVVLRGYGPQASIANFAKDLGNVEGVYRVDIVSSEEKTVPDGGGSVVKSNVFEINVWFGEE